MTRLFPLVAITTALMALCLNASAATRPAHCELRIDGKSYLNGPCPVSTNKGGITINVARKGVPVTYFAYVGIDKDGSGSASWNRDKGSLHAWAPLGRVMREGDCWTNSTARICVSK